MQQGVVYCNDIVAGLLQKLSPDDYRFTYDDSYFNNPALKAISLSLPKNQQEHRSHELFPFFAGLLSEGINKRIQCRMLKIDENDGFTRLLKAAEFDTIGAITIKESK